MSSANPTRPAPGSPGRSRRAQQRSAVTVVGSLHYDIMVRTPYLPRQGETLMGSQWWWKPGGKGGNQAMAAARHGAAVEMIGALGVDDFGVQLRTSLRAAGVGLAHVRDVPGGSGLSVALVESGGDYSAVVVSGANLSLDAAQIEASADLLGQTRVLILQNEIGEPANVAAARIVRAAGGTVILNAAPARAFAPGLVGLVDVLVVNAIEAEMLGAGKVSDLQAAASAALSLSKIAATVIVTAGGHGLAAATNGVLTKVPAHHVAHAETHGAGDTFVGALAAGLAGGAKLDFVMRYANAAAALHVGAPEAGRAGIGPNQVRAFIDREPQV